MQFLAYLAIGCAAAMVNLISFLALFASGFSLIASTVVSFLLATAANYFLCIALLFRHKARWKSAAEVAVYGVVVVGVGAFDLGATSVLYSMGMAPWRAKSFASLLGLVFNFLGRKYVVF